MSELILFNKPFGVVTQFSPHEKHKSLAEFIDIKDVYPAGRLDHDSEGLLLLTDDGKLQDRITSPKYKMEKTYWVQVEGAPTADDLVPLSQGILLKDGITLPAKWQLGIGDYDLWPRNPPIRVRRSIPDTWLTLTLEEGKNRQVRRMCAALGFPVLRLIRYRVGSWTLDGLESGAWREV